MRVRLITFQLLLQSPEKLWISVLGWLPNQTNERKAFRTNMSGRRPHLPLDSKSQLHLLTKMVTRKRLPLKGKAMAFITTTVHNWTPVFADERCAEELLNQLNETLIHFKVSLIAYVLMPSHIHLLLGFPMIERMSDFMKSFKRLSTRRIQPLIDKNIAMTFYVGESFQMWKPRFDDVIIESENQFRIKIDYVHNNPVKDGLVKKPEDYPYSSAKDWMTDEKGELPIDKNWEWLNKN